MSGRILVVDDDPAVTRFLSADLAGEGYVVDVLADRDGAVDRAATVKPDLLLLEASALDVLRRLRTHPATSSLPVILLSDRPDQREPGLAAGADDVVAKPFDALDVAQRVGGTLRRTADMRALSPLTGLPGNHRIDREIASRAAAGTGYAVCHVDLDEFKGFNDRYGFQRGDELLLLLAACLQRAANRVGTPTPFLGHVGGDDFVVVCTPDQAAPLCEGALAEFDDAARAHYDAEDLANGWLEVVDRRGVTHRQPLVSVSVGVASDPSGERDVRAVIGSATEMKRVAKSERGSFVAQDRRGA